MLTPVNATSTPIQPHLKAEAEGFREETRAAAEELESYRTQMAQEREKAAKEAAEREAQETAGAREREQRALSEKAAEGAAAALAAARQAEQLPERRSPASIYSNSDAGFSVGDSPLAVLLHLARRAVDQAESASIHASVGSMDLVTN